MKIPPLPQRLARRSHRFLSSEADDFSRRRLHFATGMISNQDYSLWDYRQMPFNFMGQVCLQNSLVYTTAATLIVWVFYPLIDKVLRNAPQGAVNAVGFELFGMYLFLAALHFVDLSAIGIGII